MAALCPSTAPNGAIAQLLADRSKYHAFLCRRVNAAAAEDILQAAYLRIVERGIALRDEHRLASWFYTVLRNAAIDHMRSSARSNRLRCELAVQPERTAEPGDNLASDAAQSLIASLEPRHRDALETVYLERGSIADIAHKAGITRNAATVRLHRARQALTELVGRSGTCRSTRARQARRGMRVMPDGGERQQG
jgi:RNA polymerase sigma-70 factor, ECF subfamily